MDLATSRERLSERFCTKRRLWRICCFCVITLFGIELLRTHFTTDCSFPEKFFSFPFGSRIRADLNTAKKLDSLANDTTNDFQPISISINGTGLLSFFDMCIERLDSTVQPITSCDDTTMDYWNDTKRIVVYNSFNRRGLRKIKTIRSPRTLYHLTGWDIYFSPSRVPQSHTMLETTAYFVDPIYPVNLHHFWYDWFSALYTVMKETNRLHVGADN